MQFTVAPDSQYYYQVLTVSTSDRLSQHASQHRQWFRLYKPAVSTYLRATVCHLDVATLWFTVNEHAVQIQVNRWRNCQTMSH
jgi:hypothetical protein